MAQPLRRYDDSRDRVHKREEVANDHRKARMSIIQRFTQVFGIIYVLAGIAGFVPPLLTGNTPGVTGPFAGLLFGLFAVNWLHNLAHLAVGAVGLAVYRSLSASITYVVAVEAAYILLALLGLFTEPVGTLGGILPLNGWDDLLHILTAAAAFGATVAFVITAQRRRAR